MILASTGALPTCLTKDAAPSAVAADLPYSRMAPSYVIIGGMNDQHEQELMQLVMPVSYTHLTLPTILRV